MSGLRFQTYRAVSRTRRALQALEQRMAPATPLPPSTARERALASVPRMEPPPTRPSATPAVTVLGHLDPAAFFGGIATAITVAGALAERTGRLLRVACTLGVTVGTVAELRALLAGNGIAVGEIVVDDVRHEYPPQGALPLHADDILVASSWYDAHAAAALVPRFVYVVQDFEPNFYPTGDRYALADATYALPQAVPLFNSSVLRDWFLASGYETFVAAGTFFEPARGLPLRAEADTQRRVFFYGRPGTERNLYALGLLSLDLVSTDPAAAGWTFHAAGDAEASEAVLAGGQRLRSLGKLSVTDYLRFAATVDVALSPMLAPHPNYPTLELAALGARVVTTHFGTKTDLSRYSDRIALTEPTAEAMAAALLQAMAAPVSRTPATLPATWPEALADPVSELLARLGRD